MPNGKGQFKKGEIPWNKGKKGLQVSWLKGKKGFKHSGSFKKGHPIYKGIEKGWFKNGHRGFWTGKKRLPFSKEWRVNMSEVKMDRFRGDKNPNWKGGRKRGHYTDWEYNEWRNKIYKQDNFTCWTCEIRGGKLQAHHLKDWFNYPELRYDIRNGLTLCKICHQIYTKFKNKKKLGELSVLGRQIKEVKTN